MRRVVIPFVLHDGGAEISFEALPVEDHDVCDIPGFELFGELGVGKLLRRIPLVVHHLEQRQPGKDDQKPQCQVLEHARPIGAWSSRGFRCLAFYHTFHSNAAINGKCL